METWQKENLLPTSEVKPECKYEINNADVEVVMASTRVSRNEATNALLENNGELIRAIMSITM